MISSEGYDNYQPLRLVETRIPTNQYTDDPADQPDTTSIWQAVQRLEPVLTGTWTDKKTRRTARFELHENYTGAVRYEKVDFRMQAKDSCQVQEQGFYETRLRYTAQRNMHLLGPDTMRPALRRMQCPTPQQMHRQLAALLTQTNCNGSAFGIDKYKLVYYNGNGLLSFTAVTATVTAANLPSQSVEEHTPMT